MDKLDFRDIEFPIVLRAPRVRLIVEDEVPPAVDSLQPDSVHAGEIRRLVLRAQRDIAKAQWPLDLEARHGRLAQHDDGSVGSRRQPRIIHTTDIEADTREIPQG